MDKPHGCVMQLSRNQVLVFLKFSQLIKLQIKSIH